MVRKAVLSRQPKNIDKRKLICSEGWSKIGQSVKQLQEMFGRDFADIISEKRKPGLIILLSLTRYNFIVNGILGYKTDFNVNAG